VFVSVVRFVNLLSEELERTENRERAYGLSLVVNGQRQHRNLTLRDKRKTLRMFADRVCSVQCFSQCRWICLVNRG